MCVYFQNERNSDLISNYKLLLWLLKFTPVVAFLIVYENNNNKNNLVETNISPLK